MQEISRAIVEGSLDSIKETSKVAPADSKEAERRRRQMEVQEEFGADAKVVPPYKPNRKQRRAQKARSKK